MKTVKLIIVAALCGTLFSGGMRADETNPLRRLPETTIQELKPAEGELPRKIHPGETLKFAVDVPGTQIPMDDYLRVAGFLDGTGYGEGGFRRRDYPLNETAEPNSGGDGCHLMIRGWEKPFVQNAYCLIRSKDLQGGGRMEVKLDLAGENLKTLDGGRMGMTFEFYLKNPKYRSGDVSREPDRTAFVPFPPGSYDWRTVGKTVDVPKNVDAVLISIGGFNFAGTMRAKLPVLSLNGKDLTLPLIGPQAREWVGSNISRLAWPEFTFALDGKPFFSGPVFQKAAIHDADFELDMPDPPPGRHVLTITLDRSWGSDKGYAFSRVQMLGEKARAFEIIGVPRFVAENSGFAVLLETRRDDVALDVGATEGAQPLRRKVRFARKGIHAVPFKAGKAGTSPELTFKGETRTEGIKVVMVTSGADDGIRLSTSDWIYAGHSMFKKYMKWLYANGIVNSVVVRPSYQWGGTRTRDEAFFRNFKRVCESLHWPYSLMVEGRTLPGARINPKDEWIDGAFYMGRQAHEDDGSYYYWGVGGPYHNNLQRMLMGRFLDGGGIFPKFSFSRNFAKNMKEGAEYFAGNIKKAKHESTRHTGPSVLFRYFYQIGYDWLGAEQVYGPEEIIVSSLRGASRAYGKTRYGSHHATQWGLPRYSGKGHEEAQFKSHAVAYLHGVTHINTEDALWNTERIDWRFSEAALRHVARQRDFLDYVLTHRRRGVMVTPIAVLQGRYDAWSCFGRQPIWAQQGRQWAAGDAEASFDLLKVFYPRKKLNGFSVGGTPFGPIDMLPVEAPQDVLDDYQTLIFLGWNTYDEAEFGRLLAYVKNGGTLIMTKAHLNTNLTHNAPVTMPRKSAFLDAIRSRLGDGTGGDARTPRRIRVGKGTVVMFDTDKYPGAKDLKEAYAAEMRKAGERAVAAQRDKGWLKGSESVEFAAWDSQVGDAAYRTIYMLNTRGPSAATLLLGDAEFPIDVKPGVIDTLFISDGIAVKPSDPLTSVLRIFSGKAGGLRLAVQAVNPCELTVFDAASKKIRVVKVTKTGLGEVEVP
jgi:hypothetical protein